MTKKKSEAKTYRQLKQELDELTAWFEQDDFEIEQATAKFKEATAIIAELEAKLTETEHDIQQITKERHTP